MNAKHATKYVLIIFTSLLNNYVTSSYVIDYIGSQLCPYTSFCQRNAAPYVKPLLLRPCCSDCSCDANCWETATCCPDQDVAVHSERIAHCKSSIVKAAEGFSSEIWGHRVIDYCPSAERNASLIAKCSVEGARDFVDMIRVSDDVSGKVYQNRFCAECHHLTGSITEWPLVAQCSEDVYTHKESWKSFLLSDKCQLTSKEPDNVSVEACALPKDTTCNQTGLWQTFDADVKWACELFEAVFFLRKSKGGTSELDSYRNIYCYVCNTDEIGTAETLCPGQSFNDPGLTVFTSLIDHRRYEETAEATMSQTACRSYEIKDTVMKKCRLLKCPFGSAPVDETCKPLFVGTVGLYIDIRFTLTVIWSRTEYKLRSKTSMLRNVHVGQIIIDHFLNKARFARNEFWCPYCNLELKMTADISRHGVRSLKGNDVIDDVTDSSKDVTDDVGDGNNHMTNGDVINITVKNNGEDVNEHNATFPAFILKAIMFTKAGCQLQNIYDIAREIFGKVIEVKEDGEIEMQLQVGLLKDNTFPANHTRKFKVLKTVNNHAIRCKAKGAHRLKDEKLCSKIQITYNEFEPHVTGENIELISSFFKKEHIETSEPVELCVDTYYEKLESIDFQLLSRGHTVTKDTSLCTGLIFVIVLLLD